MYYMSNLIIIGATSSICRNKVFHNLSTIDVFEKIYCYGWENWNTDNLVFYLLNEVNGDVSNIISKVEFIQGDYNDYECSLLNIINDKTIIYVSTPPCCYYQILEFNKTLSTKGLRIVFEKPFANNYEDYKRLRPLIKPNVYIVDHFMYKVDILDLVDKYKNSNIENFKISFLYSEGVEHRLGYFNKTGLFKDMFQSHFLAVLYSIIGDKLEDLLKCQITTNIRKQYANYGGDLDIDTYFCIEMKDENCNYIFESGKCCPDKRCVIINNNEYIINSYENEYSLFFVTLLANNHCNLMDCQDLFWRIYHFIQDEKWRVNLIDAKY